MILFKSLGLGIFDTLFPRKCVGCGKYDDSICEECAKDIVLTKKQQCVRCLKTTPGGKTCTTCKKYFTLDQLLVATFYDQETIKEAVGQFKYSSRLDLTKPLTDLIFANSEISDFLTSTLTLDHVVIPVPLYRQRSWWRGYNQSDLLAKNICNHYHLKYQPKALRRTRQTKVQAGLHRNDRLINLQNAFEVKNPAAISNKTVILVDDIATTGSTLEACSIALKTAGAKKITGLVVARAL